MKEKLVSMGTLCHKCLEQDSLTDENIGVMVNLPEEILTDGAVVYTSKCNICGYIEKFEIKPSQPSRRTGVHKCTKCGYEYFYCILASIVDEMVELWDYYSQCPNCGIRGYQGIMIEHYGPLRHEHGKYGMHPITQKHRLLKE